MKNTKETKIVRPDTLPEAPEKLEFESYPRSFGIGQDIQPRKDLSRFVKWPEYIKIQRQRRVFSKKLKVPFVVSQFTRVLDKNMSKQVFKLLLKYQSSQKPKKKVFSVISKENSNKNSKSLFLKHGINSVSNLIIKKKALFVLIAHDVNPIECIVWLPSLCFQMDIPFCIIKNKSKLGGLIGRKKTSCISVSYVPGKYKDEVEKITECFRSNFNDRYEDAKKRWTD
mmetsp:Transcript_46971/g.96042  ORF Transcript_46971/g.96042 Transcript_46971/m.96042 type:complete len:226 (-) Transcript_46971:4480-5157(-)